MNVLGKSSYLSILQFYYIWMYWESLPTCPFCGFIIYGCTGKVYLPVHSAVLLYMDILGKSSYLSIPRLYYIWMYWESLPTCPFCGFRCSSTSSTMTGTCSLPSLASVLSPSTLGWVWSPSKSGLVFPISVSVCRSQELVYLPHSLAFVNLCWLWMI